MVNEEGKRNDKTLDESSRLRGDHSSSHCLKQLRKYRQDSITSNSEKMNDKVANEQTTRLILALELFGDNCENVFKTALAGCRI